MYGHIKLAFTCLIGMMLGLLSARYVASGGLDLVATSQNGWTVWPTAGLSTMDPYTKAHFLADGRLPDNHREIVELETTNDAAGNRLDRNCSYVVAGRLDWARWWSITTGNQGHGSLEAGSPPLSLHSGKVVFEANGSTLIHLAAEPRAGNWLSFPPGGEMRLVLRFYDPSAASRASPDTVALPRIEQEHCR